MKKSLVGKYGFLLEIRASGEGLGKIWCYRWDSEEKKVRGEKHYSYKVKGKAFLIRDYLELIDVHETSAGYTHGVYNVSEEVWGVIKKHSNLTRLDFFPELSEMESNEARIRKAEAALEKLKKAKANPLQHPDIVEQLPFSSDISSCKKIIRQIIYTALRNGDSARDRILARKLEGDGDLGELSDAVREKASKLIRALKGIISLMKCGIEREKSPTSSHPDLEDFSS